MDVFLDVPWTPDGISSSVPELRVPALRPLIGYGPNMFFYAFRQSEGRPYGDELVDQAHNLVVHTALELGLLGVGSYLAVLAALGVVLVRLLRASRRGELEPWRALTAVGLSSAMVGRVMEQMTGKAQLADLMLSWVLIGLVIALAGGAGREDTTGAEREGGPGLRTRARLLVPVLGFMVLAVVWAQTALAPVRAAVQSQVAAELAAGEEVVETEAAYRAAMAIAPDYAVPLLGLARYKVSRTTAVADAGERELVLRDARALVEVLLGRNALNENTWLLNVEITRELMGLGVLDAAVALDTADTLVELMPAHWQSHMARASTLLRLARDEDALAAMDRAMAGGGGGSATAQYLHALSLLGVGRTTDAIAAAEESFALVGSTAAADLLRFLRGQ